jgi:hypothetical protein
MFIDMAAGKTLRYGYEDDERPGTRRQTGDDA